MPTHDPSRLLQGLSFGFTEDGRLIDLRFQRADGTTAYVQCPFDQMANVVLSLERAVGNAHELQVASLKGTDPRAVYPIRPRKLINIQGGAAKGNLAVMTL